LPSAPHLGATLGGILLFGEAVTAARLVFLGLLMVAVAGLELA
jgi:multidrug transporter EmrE-like cation transporter